MKKVILLAALVLSCVFTSKNLNYIDENTFIKSAIAEEADNTLGEATPEQCSISRTVTIEQHKWIEKDWFGITVGFIITPTATPVPSASSFWNHVSYYEDISYQKTEYAQGNMILCPGDDQNCTVHPCDATFD